MTVEGLVPDPRRPKSVRVVVGGRPAWTIPVDVSRELALVEGMTLRGDIVERLDRAAEEEGAFRAALRSLERRAHGAAELAMKLGRKGHAEGAIAAAMVRLHQLGLLDDAAFAKEYVSTRAQRGRGPTRLRHDLASLGVDRHTIDSALQSLAPDADPLDAPRRLAEKRIRQLAGLPADARRRRLTAYLARRGFRGNEVRTVIEQVLRQAAA